MKPKPAAPLDRAVVAKEVQAFLKKVRPKAELLHKLDYGFRYHNRCVILFSIRPRFDDKSKKTEDTFAKARYIGTRKIWKVYWMRGNLRWHPYEPHEVGSLRAFLKLVAQDKHHCFFG